MKNIMFLFLLFFSGINAFAQQAPPACAAEEYRQFDFWIGEWEVYANDKLAGTSHIELILGDCILLENWTGVGGSDGKSFNLYNSKTKEWEQTWVDNGGGIIHFHGNFENGVMAMTAKSIARDGKPTDYKLTFWDNKNGTVRQLWEASKDGGDWKTLFDGLYKKK